MAKICAVVLNSVSRDARVLKQAESLVAAGHQVSIVGIVDKNFPAASEVTPAGMQIYRVSLVNVRLGITLLLKACVAFAATTALLLLVVFDTTFTQLPRGLAVAGLIFGLTFVLRPFIKIKHAGEIQAPSLSGSVGPQSLFQKVRSRIGEFLWFWMRLWPLASVAIRLGPDVIHCHDIHTLPLGVFVKKRTNCRLVYDAHEIYEETAQGNPADARRCKRVHGFCQRFVDGFITINESIAAWYAKQYPKLPQATIIMNAARRSETPLDYDGRLHDAAGLPQDALILLYQGGFSTHRGLELLVSSASNLPPSWFLVMMGWGGNEKELRAIGESANSVSIIKYGYAAVRFIPPAPQSELALWSAGATIGVIPYENTGLNHWFCTPNKLWEYPNAGVPMLVSPFPEMRRQVEHYRHGWLLPDELSAEGIANAVSYLSCDEISAAKQNTVRFISENHWGTYEERLFQLYERVRKTPAAFEGG
jgi:glycosyltransferase involved in cell wall biosynthesis